MKHTLKTTFMIATSLILGASCSNKKHAGPSAVAGSSPSTLRSVDVTVAPVAAPPAATSVATTGTTASSGADLSEGAVDPISKPAPAFSTGNASSALREEIVTLLSEGSPLGEIVKLQLSGGLMSAATAKNMMKPLTTYENDKDFGPFVLDVKKVESNFVALQEAKKFSRSEAVREYQASIEKLNDLFSRYLDALQREGGQTLKGENRRASQITQTVTSIR